MFERYTEKARRTIFFARSEASQYGSPYIEPEHMLLGLLREDKLLFARLLPAGPDVNALREALQHNMQEHSPTSISVDLPLSTFCKRSLAFATEESDRCGAKYIGPAHLLLGLLREESPVSEMFRQHGLTLAAARQKVVRQVTPSSGGSARTLAAVRLEFAPLIKRLTSEIEPVTTFQLRSPEKDAAS